MGKVLGLPGEINVAAAVLSGDYILASAAGSVAAYAAMGSVSAGMVQLCAILMIAGVRFIMPADKLTFFGRHNEAAFTSLMTGAVLMLFGSVVSLSVPTDAFTVSLRMINALLCGCTGLREYLISKRIFVPTYWPGLVGVHELNECEYAFVNCLLPLPVDQRYGEEEMKTVVKTVLEKEDCN
jgi:hypothetical protein